MKSFFPVLLAAALLAPAANLRAAEMMKPAAPAEDKESLPAGAKVVALEVTPASVKLAGKYDSAQLLVNAKLSTGDTADVTRLVSYKFGSKVAEISPTGQIGTLKNGRTELTISLGGKSEKVAVEVANFDPNQKVDFIRDVNPVLAKLGCNAGTCHGAKDGKAGFKLSLRGYDPIYDVRALVDDLAGRRVNFASPDDSLMLLKATGAVPHEGGQRTKFGDKYYQLLRAWIADSAKLNLTSARVAKIEISPKDPVVQDVGSRQQVRIIATYPDGRQRDVTAEAFIESGNGDVHTADGGGLMRTLRRGEAPVLARYEGAYAATTVTVMGDRTGFVWKEQPANNKLDELVAAKWQRMKILPSGLCTDDEFIRRVYLDLTGLPPTADDVRKFLADKRDTRAKRDELIDRLIGNPDYVDHWANKWADLLQVNGKFLGTEGAKLFREWIHTEVEKNTPYDQFAKKILTASGSNRENPASSYFKILRTPAETMENTTHLFLATRFNCNKCHDHPFERWTQDQYYQMAAFFAQVDLKRDPESGNKNIGGTAVEGAKPLYEIIADKKDGDVKHERTGKITPPDFPYPAKFDLKKDKAAATRREELAGWMTSADNRYFAMSYVNRLWGYLTGVGVIEPLDDIRAGNPASNPELLNYLTQEFVSSGFNVQHVLKLIAKSRTYQLSLATQKWNSDDKINYSHATARRLPAEVLYDAVLKVTGSTPNFPGVKAGTRAAQLPDSAIDVPSGFLANLGRPARESACECERNGDLRLGSVMALLSGPAVSTAINDPKNELAKLVVANQDDRKLIEEVFVRILNRAPAEKEITTTLAAWKEIDPENTKLAAQLAAAEKAWAPVYTKKQAEREDAIKSAKSAVAARTTEVAPQVAADEKKRQQQIVAATKAVADFEKTLDVKQVEWEKSLDSNRFVTGWVPLEVKTAKANNNIELKKLDDGSWLASGPVANFVDYVITAETKQPKVTGFMLEVLPHESLPNSGPGRAAGNFVLSELLLTTGDKAGRRSQTAVAFKDARADFSQKNFDVKEAINGKSEGGRDGWAVGGGVGAPHFARFSLAKPLGDDKGTSLTFTMQHRFRDGFQIGRFRLWATTSTKPLELGLPADVLSVVKTPAAERTEAQIKSIAAYYRTGDAGLLKKQQALATAKKPLAEDPKLSELKATLANVEMPVPIDPKLLTLRADAEMSAKQTTNKRLTGAQDLAWALINNPSFLFNR
ncbi:MAG: DUF1549 domain-containing protein [Verrucomicrobia bacterium]|nr:DUF1549 domain-containing protein [Verrucomicrobiota bacterium]